MTNTETTVVIDTRLTQISLPANMLFLAKTGYSKTYTFRELYTRYWKSQVKLTYVICPTAEFSHDYDNIVKSDKYLLTNMRLADAKIDEICKLCKNKCRKSQKYPVMLVIDDALGVINFNTPKFANLFAISRHINLTLVLMMQNLTKFMTPCLRNNLGYIFVGRISDSNLKCLYELADWENYNEMKEYLRKYTVNYQMILVDKKSDDCEPYVFRA